MERMISYAQNHEDVLLARLFPRSYAGFYVDIGANHPTHCSITRHFYDQGWSGINVEPGRIFHELQAARPRDINLNIAVSDRSGEATFYEYPKRTTDSTLSPEVVVGNQQFGDACQKRTIQTLSLRDLCERHVGDRTVDFMSIDVEGLENAIVGGGDWRRWRPRVVVIEATRPHSREAADISWERTLLDCGYLFANFDGLNRYYVRVEDEPFLKHLNSPVCIHDDFESYHTLVRIQQAVSKASQFGPASACQGLAKGIGKRFQHMVSQFAGRR